MVLDLFQPAAIYIQGRCDYYFYEYMSEVCGDGLLPFLIYYSSECPFDRLEFPI